MESILPLSQRKQGAQNLVRNMPPFKYSLLFPQCTSDSPPLNPGNFVSPREGKVLFLHQVLFSLFWDRLLKENNYSMTSVKEW